MARKSITPGSASPGAGAGDGDDGPDVPAAVAVTWAERAAQVVARPVEAAQGRDMFMAVWRATRQAVVLDDPELARFAAYLEFVQIRAEREVIVQDEPGDFMLIVLEGRLSVERQHTGGARTRLSVARAGDMLGEMALLDAGTRFSACTTRTTCTLGVLGTRSLESMVCHEPRLALALYSSLSRRLSLRLRHASARLSALLSPP